MNRRKFIEHSLVAGAGLAFGPQLTCVATVRTTQVQTNGFFTIGKEDGHWWLIDPEGKPFFTVGLNHIDPASLRYPENIHIWREKYEGSSLKWIQESVVPNLRKWRFNTVG